MTEMKNNVTFFYRKFQPMASFLRERVLHFERVSNLHGYGLEGEFCNLAKKLFIVT